MNPEGQVVLFQKIRSLFSRATVGVPIHAKKKYRLTFEELAKVRNLCVLYAQVFPHLQSRMAPEEAKKWEAGFVEGTTYDDDFNTLLESRPSKFALSMLKSRREAARQQEIEKQNLICCEVAAQKEAVQEAQWKFFCSALKQDQAMLAKVKTVPAKIKAKLHEKAVLHRQKQAEAGLKATAGYQDRFL